MADRCWCGKALVARDIEAFRGTNEEPLQTVVFECPVHGADWERPPEGLVPALVEALRDVAIMPVCEYALSGGISDCKECDNDRCSMKRALALLDQPGEGA